MSVEEHEPFGSMGDEGFHQASNILLNIGEYVVPAPFKGDEGGDGARWWQGVGVDGRSISVRVGGEVRAERHVGRGKGVRWGKGSTGQADGNAGRAGVGGTAQSHARVGPSAGTHRKLVIKRMGYLLSVDLIAFKFLGRALGDRKGSDHSGAVSRREIGRAHV